MTENEAIEEPQESEGSSSEEPVEAQPSLADIVPEVEPKPEVEPAVEEPAAEPVAAAPQPSFDDIAPGTVAGLTPEEPAPVERAGCIPWWPFLVYDAVWAAFSAALVWLLLQAPVGPVYEYEVYRLSLIVGLTLTVFGPVLIIIVWLACKGSAKGSAGTLFVDALVRGSVATFGGVAMWFVALIIIDQLRLGRIL